MRKVLTVALLAVFVVGITGLLTVAESTRVTFSDPVDQDSEILELTGIDLSEDQLDGVEKVIVITPKGIEDGEYEIKNENSNGKNLVIVDPIHVIK